MKKKILFVTDRYYPEPYANGICVHNVARSFVQAGHEAHILAFDIPGKQLPAEKDGVKVFGIVPDLANRLIFSGQNRIDTAGGKAVRACGILLLRLNKIRLISQYPLASSSFHRRILEMIGQLDRKYRYDAIVGAYNPLDTALAAAEYHRMRPDVLTAIYNLDYMPESIKNHVSEEKVKKSCAYWEERIYPAADMVLEMESNCRRRDEAYRTRWADRLTVTDLPLFVREDSVPAAPFDEGSEHWVYAGALDTAYYQVEDALKIFCALPGDRKRVLHIYGRGTGYEICRKYEAENPGKIIVHGFVSHDELKGILKGADVLLSMKKTDLISGKTFEYMGTGNRVVHLQGSVRDPNAEYLRRYDRSVIVATYDRRPEEAAAELADRLDRMEESRKQDIGLCFEKNTPEYTRDLILESLK